jgi:hypothetical protein
VVTPPALLADIDDPQLKAKVDAAFTTAGGGSKGLEAMAKQLDQGTRQEQRASSPQIIQSSFPNASDAERTQLQAAMDAAKNTESGLKEAAKIRTEQRRLKKAKGFQERAVFLLDKVLNNPELNDVIGSSEGKDEGFLFGDKIRSDKEAEAIADIKELESILTAENLSLMTGVLSETDIAIIRSLGAGALIRTRGEDRFIEDVTELKDKLSSQLVQTVDDTAQLRSGDNLEEGAIIRNPQTGQRLQVVNGELVEVQ